MNFQPPEEDDPRDDDQRQQAAATEAPSLSEGIAKQVMKLCQRACAQHLDYSNLRRNNWNSGEALKARKAYRATLDEIESLVSHLAAPAAAVPESPAACNELRSAIGACLNDAMNSAVANGANGVSMPDYMVQVAAWLAGLPVNHMAADEHGAFEAVFKAWPYEWSDARLKRDGTGYLDVDTHFCWCAWQARGTLGASPTQAPAATEAPSKPFAYYIHIAAEQRGEFVHDLDEALDDLTNCECKITELFAHAAPADECPYCHACWPECLHCDGTGRAVQAPSLREACAALLALIRRDAPHLSGKALGDAEAALAAVGASVQPVQASLSDEQREALIDMVNEQHMTATYHCLRVWEAWNVGTMSQDDFQPANESDMAAEIVDAILAELSKGAK